MIPFNEAIYLWGVLLIVPIWVWLFTKSGNKSRKDILLSGVLYGIAAVLIAKTYALTDYWNPPYLLDFINIEDFLYGFFYGGVISELYERLSGYKSIRGRGKRRARHILFFFLAILVAVGSFFVLVDVLGFNSIVAHIVPLVFIFFGVVYFRRDLIRFSIKSGVFITILTLLWMKVILLIEPSAIEEFWKLENLSGILLLAIPIEEYIFAFTLGTSGSVLYELVMGESFKNV